MEKSKKYKQHAMICPDCKGNGYISSEGEIYVDESEVIESYVDADLVTDDDHKLH